MAKPLSLLFTATGFAPEKLGGRATYLYELTRSLAEQGAAVTVLAGSASPDQPRPSQMAGLRLLHYPVASSNLLFEQRSHLRGLARRLRALAREGMSFDAVICDDPVAAASLARSQCFREAKRVYSFHSPVGAEVDLGLESAARAGGRGVKERLRPFVYRCYRRWAVRAERAGLKGADLIVCLSEYMRGELLAAHPGLATRVAVIPGGVDTSRFCPQPDRERKRKQLGVGAEDRLLVTVRRLESRMGLDNLLAALPRAIGKANDVKLLLAGEGQEREALARQIEELGLSGRARLLGRVAAEELPGLYAAADLFVLPTRCLEGFGLAALEALACGTPVVATPVGATPEWLTGLDGRMLTASAAPEAIAEGIVGMLAVCRGEGELLRRRCRSYAERFRWSSIGQRFAGELCSLREPSAAREEVRQWSPT